MCGITGFCDFNKTLTAKDISNANQALAHRGPDGEGVEIYETKNALIGFGHKRLSIIDLSEAAKQPMHSADGNVSLILNGEIYNYSEIKIQLTKLGHSFKTKSDTEVIVKAYEQWGVKMVDYFIGMFAFVLLDKRKNTMYFFRDRAGVKPFYYYEKNNCILFASELKALHAYPNFKKEIQEKSVSLYFTYGYIPAPYTIFKHTQKVLPGHYLKINLETKQSEEIKYYDVINSYNKPKISIREEEAMEEVEKLMISSFNYRMVSDVPVGVFLSGGYDSSAVAAILQSQSQQKIKTFTIGFEDENYNEATSAKKIAAHIGTDHHEYFCTVKESQEILPQLAEIFDEPFGDSSAIPTILVSRFAKKNVTVALSADGGDEIFAGYNRYSQLAAISAYLKNIPRLARSFSGSVLNSVSSHSMPLNSNNIRAISRLSEVFTAKNDYGIYEALNRHFTQKQLKSFLQNPIAVPGLYDEFQPLNKENDFINTVLALDYKTYMADDILVKVDKATMSCGLEGREPFLDHRLIDFVARLPSEMKYNAGNKKYLLKQITHKYVPQNLLDRPKSGFSIPIFEWLKGDLKEYLLEYITEEELAKHGYINIKEAIKIRDGFLAGKSGNEIQVWLILMFQLWWRRWM